MNRVFFVRFHLVRAAIDSSLTELSCNARLGNGMTASADSCIDTRYREVWFPDPCYDPVRIDKIVPMVVAGTDPVLECVVSDFYDSESRHRIH